MLWLKSRSSEIWLDRRTTYTRSTAVMSMVRGGEYACGEIWLDRRTIYMRSTAVMSMVKGGEYACGEIWLDRRTIYTRTPAPVCRRLLAMNLTLLLPPLLQVGYILGLGDRHPSNLMLDRYSGKLLHIDFGDCFEASMTREKFPEKVRGRY